MSDAERSSESQGLASEFELPAAGSRRPGTDLAPVIGQTLMKVDDRIVTQSTSHCRGTDGAGKPQEECDDQYFEQCEPHGTPVPSERADHGSPFFLRLRTVHGSEHPTVMVVGEQPHPVNGLSPTRASARFLQLIPRDFARDHGVLSQGMEGEAEVIAVVPETTPQVIWNLSVRLGHPLSVRITDDRETLIRSIDQAYEQHVVGGLGKEVVPAIGVEVAGESFSDLLAAADRDLLTTSGKAPLVKLLDRLLFSAVSVGASDLHLQPTADHLLVRQRVDGVLEAGQHLPMSLAKPLLSRVKVLGRMDVADRLVPQDGRMTLQIGDRMIDVRISTIPTAYGERAVLRLLDTKQQLITVSDIGMPEHVSTQFLRGAARASGIILVTGPTGSGKTTTLYATLRSLNSAERNTMTIEDPIEYELSSLGFPISQSQVNQRKGITFANGLRHVLRQDPDVIMVGEIRDPETARIAIQASLTGHLVFSTLHTNDASSAITRLLDLGVEPFLVAASLSAVLAQRLVRTTCRACGGTGMIDQTQCATCHGGGFKGRTGIFELITVDHDLRQAISSSAGLHAITTIAKRSGMTPLAEEGARLVAQGLTTTAEVERVIHHG